MAQQQRRRRSVIAMPVGLAVFLASLVCGTVGGSLWLIFRDTSPHVLYKGYPVNEQGWQPTWSKENDTCGNYASGVPLQSFAMALDNLPDSVGIRYAGYVANIGWKEASQGKEILSSEIAQQTQGLEAIKATLVNAPPGMSVEYRAHFPKSGWTEWIGDGIFVGVPGGGEYLDGIQARLVVDTIATGIASAKDGTHVDISEIFFKVGSDEFNFSLPETSRNLARLYRFVQTSCDDMRIIIEGHSSSEGDSTLNQRLSELRAMKVRDWLVSKGVNSAKIIATQGFGATKPKVPEPSDGSIAASELEKIRRQNRRISIAVQRGCP
ncbi:MAG: OmpA family protein [Candidatus Kapabacteria bacterium]|nr:OmpA family protein [Candidatus Kapabacteria bacterium]